MSQFGGIIVEVFDAEVRYEFGNIFNDCLFNYSLFFRNKYPEKGI